MYVARSHAIEMVFIVTGHAGSSASLKFHVIIGNNNAFFKTLRHRSGSISGHLVSPSISQLQASVVCGWLF